MNVVKQQITACRPYTKINIIRSDPRNIAILLHGINACTTERATIPQRAAEMPDVIA